MKTLEPTLLLLCKDSSKISFFQNTFQKSYTLIIAENLPDALDWIKSSSVVELVFIDPPTLESPLPDACKSLRKAIKDKSLPILLISNTLKKSFILDSLNAGVSDFIHEPLDALEIQERISVYLHSKLTSKKMKFVTSKIKAAPLIPRNAKMLREKKFIRSQTLQQIAAAKKNMLPVSLLMISVDSFSRLEELLKKSATDELLLFLDHFLQKRLRKYDTLSIEAPGQYMMLLPKTSQTAARVIADDIRKEISSTTIPTSVKEMLITVSIGVVCFEKELSKSAQDFEQFDLCLDRVKKSLVRAQKKGNTIVENPS